jgi:hypothetical protein
MIYYLATQTHLYTMRDFLAGPGAALAPRMRVSGYLALRNRRDLPRGVYIFSDIDRLSGSQSAEVYLAWQKLKDAGVTILNHPINSMRRYELLRKLHEDGINDFDAYMLVEHRKPKRFPVFVRKAYDHGGAHSPLLTNQAELDAEIDRLDKAGIWPGDRLIVEFVETADPHGVRRKYAAMRIGDRLIPRQILHSKEWVIKRHDLHTPEFVAEEIAYLDANPDAGLLMKIFELARIEYGRIDYSFANGRLQVFEINANPTVIGRSSTAALTDPDAPRGETYRGVMQRIVDAFEALDTEGEGPPIPLRD